MFAIAQPEPTSIINAPIEWDAKIVLVILMLVLVLVIFVWTW